MRDALAANFAEFYLRLGRAGGGQERRDATLDWTIGGSPIAFQNAVIPRGPITDADIAEASSLFESHKVTGTWHVAGDDALCARLLSRGLTEVPSIEGMAVEIANLRPATCDAEIMEIRAAAELHTFTSLIEGFGLSSKEADWFGAMFEKLGYGPGQSWRHYVARLNGIPVATTTSLMTGDVCGIYFVFTALLARGQGIGGAMTRHALTDSGCRIGILGASSMGVPVYRRLALRQCHLPRASEHAIPGVAHSAL